MKGSYCRRAAVAVLLVAICGSAAATPILDQSHNPGVLALNARIGVIGSTFEAQVFQSFTVGVAGTLDSVSLFVGSNGAPTEDLIIEIVSSSNPTGAALAGGSVGPAGITPVAAGGAFVNVNLSAAGLAVAIGDIFQIRARSAQDFDLNINEYVALGNSFDGYAGGVGDHWFASEGFQNQPGWDFYFQTFVDAQPVPESATVLLLGLGLIMLGFIRSRHHDTLVHSRLSESNRDY